MISSKNRIKNEDSDSEEEEESEINDKEKLYKINQKVIENKNNYRKYIELSFNKYRFKDSQTEFQQIKKLCFLYILNINALKNINWLLIII